MRRSGMLDNGRVSPIRHAMITRAARRLMHGRGRRVRRSAARWVRRAFLAMWGAPSPVQIVGGTVLLVMVWAAVNGVVQVIRKPTEVFAVGGSLAKVPAQTWQEYGPLFDAHSTAVVTPELLAALAQVESSGDKRTFPLIKSLADMGKKLSHADFKDYGIVVIIVIRL